MNENEEKVEYTENSYTGIIIFLVIFAIIAITATTVMGNLYLEKNKDSEVIQPSISGEKIENEDSEDIGRTEVDQTYVLNLDEFYTTNNLKTEENDLFSGELVIQSQYDWARKYEENINYIQIDGLKDEELEKTINEDIKNNAFNILQHQDVNKYDIAEVESAVTANFSNILSIETTSYLYNEHNYEEGSVRIVEYYNYNLTNGEQIKLEEIFAEGASIKELLTERLYQEYSAHEDYWAYNEYVFERIGKYYWDLDYETRDEELEKMGLMTEKEWISWEYRSNIEENVLKTLLELINQKMDFLISDYALILKFSGQKYEKYLNIRDINDKVTFYKQFLTEESIFTNEYDLAHKEMCGWGIYGNEEIYFPVENMLLLKEVYNDQYLNSETFKLAEEKLDADIEYAKATKGKFFIAKMTVYDAVCYYDKVEIDMQDYEKNKNDILKLISRYEDEPFIRDSEIEEFGIEYVICDYGYVDISNNRYGYILESDQRILTNEEINKLDLEKLNLAYNEIFARHGHDFVTKDLRAHFGTKIWYKPMSGKTASLEELSDIEKHNLELIKTRISEQKSLGKTE